jgi:tetratricopeptide (TPR) repeat protein
MDFLQESSDGVGSLVKLRAEREKNPNDLLIEYKLFRKYIERGDVDGVVSSGKRIILRAEEAKSIKNKIGGRNNILDDTKFSIRTVLNRSGRAEMLKYFDDFPGIKFSLSAHKLLADIYSLGPVTDRTGRFFDRAIENYPVNVELKIRFVDYCLTAKQSTESGIKAAESLLKSGKLSEYQSARLNATVFLMRGEEQKALSVFGDEFMSEIPNDTEYYHEYARLWALYGGNLKNALKYSKIAVNRMKKHEYHYILGLIHSKVGNKDESILALEEAIKLSKKDIIIYGQLLKRMK